MNYFSISKYLCTRITIIIIIEKEQHIASILNPVMQNWVSISVIIICREYLGVQLENQGSSFMIVKRYLNLIEAHIPINPFGSGQIKLNNGTPETHNSLINVLYATMLEVVEIYQCCLHIFISRNRTWHFWSPNKSLNRLLHKAWVS